MSIKVLAFHRDREIMLTENELKSTQKEGKEFEKLQENFKERAIEKIQNKTENQVQAQRPKPRQEQGMPRKPSRCVHTARSTACLLYTSRCV